MNPVAVPGRSEVERAEQLVATDALVGQQLQASATELVGIQFEGVRDGSETDQTIRLVDNKIEDPGSRAESSGHEGTASTRRVLRARPTQHLISLNGSGTRCRVEADSMSEYAELAKKWVEVTKRVAAGTWDGIVCPKNADADVLIEVREQGRGTDDAGFEYWIHCPQCGAEIYFHSKDRYSPL